MYIDPIKFWPRILFPKVREAARYKWGFYGRSDRLADSSEAVNPWAFIRVKDEIKTLKTSLESILPAISRGVIAYNNCTDGSAEFIEAFCKTHPRFIPLAYPFDVVLAGDTAYKTQNIPWENTLAGYYTAAMGPIPETSWLIKIDTDQIYAPDILRASFSRPRHPLDIVIYSRLNLIRWQGQIRVIDYTRPGDHWLVRRDQIAFKNACGMTPTNTFFAYEDAILNRKKRPISPECSSIHFPFEKDYRLTNIHFDPDSLPTIEKFLETADPEEFDPTFFNADNIHAIASTFGPSAR